MGNLDLGFDLNAVEETSISEFKLLDSGVYTAEVKECFIFKTNSGAEMLKIAVEVEEVEIKMYQNIKKKNGEPNEIGVGRLKNLLVSCQIEQPQLKLVKTAGYKDEVEGKRIVNVIGKKVKTCIRKVIEEGAEYPEYNEIELFCKPDGTNSKGENVEEIFKNKIEKNPVLKRKAKQQEEKQKDNNIDASDYDI